MSENRSASGSSRGPRSWPWWQRLEDAFDRSAIGRGWRRGSEFELLHRAMGFAALGFLTLVPLLIVVAAADPVNRLGFAQWLAEGLGLTSTSRDEVQRLFSPPKQALESTTAFGLATLAIFGLRFGTVLQVGYEKVWELPAGRWHTVWRHLVWLVVLICYLLLSAHLAPGFSRVLVAVLGTLLFFWWSQYLLLGGRISWGALLPGALATSIGLLGLRVFSQLVFSPLIASSTVSYGPVGTVLVVQSWLVGVGYVVFGGALVGRVLHEDYLRMVAWRRKRRRDRAKAAEPPR
ncbi:MULTISPECIES: YihY/virulence factor BrkB family protein [Streptomyces]|uniref:YihY/virulence factor BrkB family protein n=1 Tax=Streptomyces rhizosphaericus TaxID=114699 RepID=A0A6G4AMB0_9ACTN|nr:YihY/virulence factor BrkB family protein [Streptomyces rhizosphaericus]NEW73627.1 YihY/virulence factor BrkB family protein [Streptomyces rhizosphaericus]